MQAKEINKPHMIVKREAFLTKAFELFSTRSIESVSMQDVASASGYGVATLYRYFYTKPILVVEVAAWKWEQFLASNIEKRNTELLGENTRAIDAFSLYLDAFIRLYEKNSDMLRFNQFFNVYIQSENIDRDTLKPYYKVIEKVKELFHLIYVKAENDHTLRTDIPEEKIFTTTIHLMLAAVTRFAVGLVYRPKKGFDAKGELCLLRDLLLREFRASAE